MTDARVTRLYVFAVTLLVFFVVWAVVAARPWVAKSSSSDRQIAALAAREQRIHFESLLVRKLRAQRAQQPVAAPAPAPRSRHAAAARDHEDVVIEAHALPRDGDGHRAVRSLVERRRDARRSTRSRPSSSASSRSCRASAPTPSCRN